LSISAFLYKFSLVKKNTDKHCMRPLASLHAAALALLFANTTMAMDCAKWFAELSGKPIFVYASKASGLIVGASNDVLITALHATGLIPEVLSPWLPLANEMANVAKTATGKEWIYSGLSKQMADGVALGSILGHSMTATVNHGPATGLITFASNMGLTYWFPNKYFHTIMHGAHRLIPESLPVLRNAVKHPVGQGFVGVSMIVVIEQLLRKAEALAEQAPHIFDSHPKTPSDEQKVNRAMAGFLLSGKILPEKSGMNKDDLLRYVFGATKEEGLFSYSGKPEEIKKPRLNEKEKGEIRALLKTDFSSAVQALLTEDEIQKMTERLSALVN
jgi:hypothetical protein